MLLSRYDVFNGDADGLCSLQQMRLDSPCESVLVTGAKRDSALLTQVQAKGGDAVAVFDISLDRNRDSLLRILDAGAEVAYFDHHYAGAIPSHLGLKTFIETSPGVCTSTLVDKRLNGAYRSWAIVGAFGDEIPTVAVALAETCNLDPKRTAKLQSLGHLLNYNAYGDTVDDLHFHPAELARLMRPYADPCEFLESCDACRKLADGYEEDMACTARLKPEFESASAVVIVLPDAAWARRVRGILANQMTSVQTRALAVLSPELSGDYMVSVRAPLANPYGADELCRRFKNGGGRAAAAGINHLSKNEVARFITDLDLHFASLSGASRHSSRQLVSVANLGIEGSIHVGSGFSPDPSAK
jgi:hypothetical protein